MLVGDALELAGFWSGPVLGGLVRSVRSPVCSARRRRGAAERGLGCGRLRLVTGLLVGGLGRNLNEDAILSACMF